MRNSSLISNLLKITSLLLLQSCHNYANEIINICKTDNLAMEVHAHYTITVKTEFLNESKHQHFISNELKATLQKDPFLSARLKGRDSVSDTIYSFSEIPLVTELKTQSRIYYNGKSETIIEDITSEVLNSLYYLSDNLTDEGNRIRKTIVKDGLLTAFNGKGREVVRMPYESPDLSAFLDTLSTYLNLIQQEGVPTLASYVHKLRSYQLNLFEKMNLTSLPDGNIILESELCSNLNNQIPATKSSALFNFREVTELNPEMTKTLRYELYQGSQLLERRNFSYSSAIEFQSLLGKLNIIENPVSVISETLTTNAEGKHMLRLMSQQFLKNQIIYHSKK